MGYSIKNIQKQLKNLGFYGGKVDGINGRNTKQAIKEFQASRGLVADGIAGRRTLSKLFRAKNTKMKSSKRSTTQRLGFPRETRNQRELVNYFGNVGDSSNLIRIELPYPMRIAWDLDKSITSMLVHKKSARAFEGAFRDLLNHYGLDEIKRLGLDLYGGCYNKRRIRGGKRWSTHAWGISLDLDPSNNTMRMKRGRAKFSKPQYKDFLNIMEKNGFYSLGKYHNYDWMHFQTAYR